MHNIFFTADTHFRHANLLKYMPNRPGKTIEEHDEILIERWNEVVKPGDSVYHLGDFLFGSGRRCTDNVDRYLKRLNGQVHLILGNHDGKAVRRCNWASISDIKCIKINKQRLVLCHYSMVVWRKSHYGAWQLFGHSHGNLEDCPHRLSTDVGVDSWGYRPVTLDQIRPIMAKKERRSVDHH